MNQYTVTKLYEADFKEKGSKFIAFLTPCHNIENCDIELSKIKENHPTATHHCWAYRVGAADCAEFSQDDGEPSGTAGAPILNTLRSENLVNILCVVVRYYGGTKLGKSGLIDAYGGAAKLALEAASLKQIIPTVLFSVTYPYDQQSVIEKLKHTFTLYEIDSEYTDDVQLTLGCPLDQVEAFNKRLEALSHLLIHSERGRPSFHIVD